MYVQIQSRGCYEGGKEKRARTAKTRYSGAGEVLETEVSVMTVGEGENFYVPRRLKKLEAFRSDHEPGVNSTTRCTITKCLRHRIG